MGKLWRRLKFGAMFGAGLVVLTVPLLAAFVFTLLARDSSPAAPAQKKIVGLARMQKSTCVATTGYYGITFDDGPTYKTIPLLNILAERGATATFFDIGKQAEELPDYVRAQRTIGEVGNHTFTHPYMSKLDSRARLNEIWRADLALGGQTRFYRDPYDDNSSGSKEDVKTTGKTEVAWTIDTNDWRRPAAQQLLDVATKVQPGGILLMHDGIDVTRQALPFIIDKLATRGMCPGSLQTTRVPQTASDKSVFYVIAAEPTHLG